MAYFVYILESEKNGSYYKGSTDDLKRRLVEHNLGKTSSTRRYLPWKIIWSCEKNTRSEALILEKKLKNITSRERISAFIKKHSEVPQEMRN